MAYTITNLQMTLTPTWLSFGELTFNSLSKGMGMFKREKSLIKVSSYPRGMGTVQGGNPLIKGIRPSKMAVKIQISRREELRLSPYTVLEAIGEC